MGHVIGSVLIAVAVIVGVSLSYRRARARYQPGDVPESGQDQNRRLVSFGVLVVVIIAAVLVFTFVR